ncbi:MAG: DUF362 domain-containing protein [Methanomicrobiaceae archaeon]|uniref:Iron-sulfur cluster-binding protein n=1 Tax=hydrocarbon metagenome TaxID=938273 RepID=A0A0W8FII9_9ZZZZ|nr:DUF362 domain-containing protein [Methanomicrobiaceae archaeon]MDD5419109.1 DUF362 domain-containing protein [Methanomicrobiaceae archaeon]
MQPGRSDVYVISAADRRAGIASLFDELPGRPFAGREVSLKANYNSSDPYPASTHPDTLAAIVDALRAAGAGPITLAERSGMGVTQTVLRERGVLDLAERLGFSVLDLDRLPAEGWVEIRHADLHWDRGFYIAGLFREGAAVVQTCCLKTHRFGGHFTMSLKNSVGLVARIDPLGHYNYMAELHASPHQRLMIAEINRFYPVDLVIMDAAEAFVTGGPERGEVVQPALLIAGRDRVAIDAVGVALLRSYGSTPAVMKGRIFAMEQIARAAELGVGALSAADIRVISLDDASREAAAEIEVLLDEQG